MRHSTFYTHHISNLSVLKTRTWLWMLRESATFFILLHPFFFRPLVFFPLGAKNWRSCPSSAAVPTSSFKNLVSNQVLKYSILLSWFELQIFLRHYTHTHKHTHYVFCLFICSPGLSYECGICSLVALICLLFKSHCVYLNCKYLFEKFV